MQLQHNAINAPFEKTHRRRRRRRMKHRIPLPTTEKKKKSSCTRSTGICKDVCKKIQNIKADCTPAGLSAPKHTAHKAVRTVYQSNLIHTEQLQIWPPVPQQTTQTNTLVFMKPLLTQKNVCKMKHKRVCSTQNYQRVKGYADVHIKIDPTGRKFTGNKSQKVKRQTNKTKKKKTL